jgi:hypothetical protein
MTIKLPAPTWAAIEDEVDALLARRPGDEFFAKVLTGALRVARDVENPIRGNLFASACREAVTHLLHTLAPEETVRSCHWFEQANGTTTVTRAQRADFIAHGGLMPSYVEATLRLSRDEYVKPLLEAMEDLNKHTHVKPETVLDDDEAIRWSAGATMDSISGLFDAAEECRSTVVHELRGAIDERVMDRILSETICELDELSTHTHVDETATEEIAIVEIGPYTIRFEVEGTVYVTLQYGSDSDMESGDGASMGDSYPFTAAVIADATNPAKFLEVLEPKVDNSSFFE